MTHSSPKCIVISDHNTHFFILIDQDEGENPVGRLPFKQEIPPQTLQTSHVTILTKDLLLINTHDEISAPDIFPEFSDAFDYGFIGFLTKSEGFSTYKPSTPDVKKHYTYWGVLNPNDKILVEAYIQNQRT